MILCIYYSQSGQTLRALESYFEAQKIDVNDCSKVTIVDLSESRIVQDKYPFPWSTYDFLRAQPEAFQANMKISQSPSISFEKYSQVIICYPVWFLSPATPISSFLKGLPEHCLENKVVITISSCRNMWVEAQLIIVGLVEKLGGKVHSHFSIVDTASSKVSLVNTLHFFTTGKKRFDEEEKHKKYGVFGIVDSEYEKLKEWSKQVNAKEGTPLVNDYKEGLVLVELIGRRISRFLYLPWKLLFFRKMPKIVQNIYLTFSGAITVILMLLLMPLIILIGSIPTVKKWLFSFLSKLVNRAVGKNELQPLDPGNNASAR